MTGQLVAKRRSIKVTVVEDERGAITAHVCSNNITLPKGAFDSTQESYELFVAAMLAVIGCKSFNTV